jgi:hypothetical protein
MAVLTWVATRSLRFTESYASRHVLDAQDLLMVARDGMGRHLILATAMPFICSMKILMPKKSQRSEQKLSGLFRQKTNNCR